MRSGARRSNDEIPGAGRFRLVGVLAWVAASFLLWPGGSAVADAPIVVARSGADAEFDVFDSSGNRIGGTDGSSNFVLNVGEQVRLGDWNGDFFDEINIISDLEGGSVFGYDQAGADLPFFRSCDNTGNLCQLESQCRAGTDVGVCVLRLGLTPDNSDFAYAGNNAVLLADLDGDGIDEIVVATRAFDPANATFDVFDRRGVRIGGAGAGSDFSYGDDFFDQYFVRAADTDGDGVDEIVVVVATFDPEQARFDRYDATGARTGGAGPDAAFRMGTGSPGDRFVVLAADMEGDGNDEIIVAVGTFDPNGAFFDIYDGSGERTGGASDTSEFVLGLDSFDQYRVRAGDVDGDGEDEIVVALTPFLDPDGASFDFYDFDGNDEGGAEGDSDFRLGGPDAFVIGTERFSPLTAAQDDTDEDGLFDVWESEGVRVGSGFLDLPAMNADPMHKDLFLEVDWMDGRPPNQGAIRQLIRAFALAPVDNPDGETGIRLWVDTGDLHVGREDGGAPGNSCRDGIDNGSEDGAAPGSCSDGIDNGGDGSADAQDAECDGRIDSEDPDCLGVEDDFLSDTCWDGIDNGGADGADRLDPGCPKIEDGLGPETCFDGIDNGGDGLLDGADPDCQGIEDGSAFSACLDGLNNGPDAEGGDAQDPDCLVGHDLGGGNSVPFANVSSLTERFYDIKAANFDPVRRPAFHYVVMARFPVNDHGISSGGNDATTLNDDTQQWIRNEWVDRVVTMVEGTGADQSRTVVSNTETSLILEELEELRGFANSCSDGDDNDGDNVIDGADPDCQVPDETSRYRISAVGGYAELVGNDVVVFNARTEAMSLLHELGHNLGLQHGGDVEPTCKPNYVSVMNYDYPFGIPQNGGGFIIDYSPPRFFGGRGVAPLPQLVEDNLDESTILDAADPANRFVYTGLDRVGFEDGFGIGSCVDDINNGTDIVADGLDPDCRGLKVQSPLNGDLGIGDGIDWNGDGIVPNETTFALNIDDADSDGNPALCVNTAAGPINGFNDWANIVLNFLPSGEGRNGPVNPVDAREPTDSDIERALRQINTTDLAVDLDSEPDPVEVGDDVVFRVTVTNNGPNPAGATRVESSPPTTAVVQDASDGCSDPSPGLICLSGELPAGATLEHTFTVATTGTCVDGLPAEWTATAAVSNVGLSAGVDRDPLDNSVSLTITPQDTTGPELAVPDPLVLECNTVGGVFGDDSDIVSWLDSASATDECDDDPSVTHDAPGFFLAGCDPTRGSTLVTFTATDRAGNAVSATSTVTILDRSAPEIVLTPGSTCLWSPDGTLRDVATFVTTDLCDSAPMSVAVATSDEATSLGGGTCPDSILTLSPGVVGANGVVLSEAGAGGAVQVRAERAGSNESGNGRVYGGVGVQGSDECGNISTVLLPVGTARDCPGAVCVPHDQDPKSPGRTNGNSPGGRCPAVDDGQVHDATVCE